MEPKSDLKYPSYNITNNHCRITNSPTIVGSHNKFSYKPSDEIQTAIAELKRCIDESASLSSTIKTDTISDLETVEAQLQKSLPDRNILALAWKSVERVVTGAEFISVATKISEFITKIIDG